ASTLVVPLGDPWSMVWCSPRGIAGGHAARVGAFNGTWKDVTGARSGLIRIAVPKRATHRASPFAGLERPEEAAHPKERERSHAHATQDQHDPRSADSMGRR